MELPFYKPRPARWQFSLRGMLVALTLVGVWLGLQTKWIKDRQRAREWLNRNGFVIVFLAEGTPAPWSLRPFGEAGVWDINFDEEHRDSTGGYTTKEMKRLFPEAHVYRWKLPDKIPPQPAGPPFPCP